MTDKTVVSGLSRGVEESSRLLATIPLGGKSLECHVTDQGLELRVALFVPNKTMPDLYDAVSKANASAFMSQEQRENMRHMRAQGEHIRKGVISAALVDLRKAIKAGATEQVFDMATRLEEIRCAAVNSGHVVEAMTAECNEALLDALDLFRRSLAGKAKGGAL